jgi:hypothetical protein
VRADALNKAAAHADDGVGAKAAATEEVVEEEETARFEAAVDAAHGLYVKALRELYERHRGAAGYDGVELVIE